MLGDLIYPVEKVKGGVRVLSFLEPEAEKGQSTGQRLRKGEDGDHKKSDTHLVYNT